MENKSESSEPSTPTVAVDALECPECHHDDQCAGKYKGTTDVDYGRLTYGCNEQDSSGNSHCGCKNEFHFRAPIVPPAAVVDAPERVFMQTDNPDGTIWPKRVWPERMPSAPTEYRRVSPVTDEGKSGFFEARIRNQAENIIDSVLGVGSFEYEHSARHQLREQITDALLIAHKATQPPASAAKNIAAIIRKDGFKGDYFQAVESLMDERDENEDDHALDTFVHLFAPLLVTNPTVEAMAEALKAITDQMEQFSDAEHVVGCEPLIESSRTALAAYDAMKEGK